MRTTVHTRRGALFMLLLALIALVALTLPAAFNLTWATPGQPDHQLTYRHANLSWDRATNISADGVAQLSLFQAHYDNVRASSAVMAPGTNGHNTIRLKNIVSGPIRYTAVLYRVNDGSEVPVIPDLTGEGAEDTQDYVLPSGVSDAKVVRAVTGILRGNSVQDLDVDWLWQYEVDDEADRYDTALGDETALADVTLGLYIVVEDNNVYRSGGGGVVGIVTPKTGDSARITLSFALLIASVSGIAALAVWQYCTRRRERRCRGE